MKKILVIGGIAIALVVVIALVLAGKINPIIKSGIEKTGPVILKAPVTLKGVNISFFSGSGELKGFTVGNPVGYKTDYAFQMDRLKVDLDVKSVTSDKIHIENIIIDSPNIVFEGGFNDNNLSQLQKNASAFAGEGSQKKKTASDSQSQKLLIDHILIQNGSISVSMGILQGQKLTVPLPKIELKDIGKEKDASMSDVLGEVLAAINKAVIPAVQQEVTKFGKGLGGSDEAVQGGMDKIKGFFGK